MSAVRQFAGKCTVEVYTDGSPLWPEIIIVAANSDLHKVRVSMAELHDLRYCIDRVLAQLNTTTCARG